MKDKINNKIVINKNKYMLLKELQQKLLVKWLIFKSSNKINKSKKLLDQ
jgi:hypothetical protein